MSYAGDFSLAHPQAVDRSAQWLFRRALSR